MVISLHPLPFFVWVWIAVRGRRRNLAQGAGSANTATVYVCFCLHILDGTTVENKDKLILTEIFPSVQKHDI